MRLMIRLLIALTLIVGLVWIGGEVLLAQQLRRMTQAGTGLAAGQVLPLRDPARIGVRLEAPVATLPMGRVSAPHATLWASPLSPARLVLSLPPDLTLDAGAGSVALSLTDPQASMALRPLAGLAPGRVHLASGAVALAGRPLAERVALDARSFALGAGAPSQARAAYGVDLAVARLDPAAVSALVPAALPGPVSLTARGVVWLDAVPAPAALASAAPPQVAGLRIDGAELRLGDLSARAVGQLAADAQGRAQGLVALYTRDANGLIEAGAAAGLIPENARRLAGTMLRAVSTMPLPETAAGETADWPAPAPDELRLPILFSDGRASLGPIPLGPAPQLRALP